MAIYCDAKRKLIYQHVINTLHIHRHTTKKEKEKNKRVGLGLREQINQFCPRFLEKIP